MSVSAIIDDIAIEVFDELPGSGSRASSEFSAMKRRRCKLLANPTNHAGRLA